jgi:sulfatase modifying factor 1
MRKLFAFLAVLAAFLSAEAQEAPDSFVRVKGGTFKNTKSNYHRKDVTLSDFYIGKHEVTQKEWREVMGTNPSQFQDDRRPVETVSWYDCIEYCNRRSVKEGLRPYYAIDKTQQDPDNRNEVDDVKWTVTINAGANGYRLPTEAEWEYAAGGGQLSKSYAYSGSDDLDRVAWFWKNSGDKPLDGLWSWPAVEGNNGKTRPVGEKQANELGIHDMSGNVREWCWDWEGHVPSSVTDPKGAARGTARLWKGGGWMGADFCCESSFRAGYDPHNRGNDQGFRVCRDK